MQLVNSMISFTLNVRLLFTPLFGDYTIIGRLIGFVVRIFEIVFGVIMMGILSIVAITLPILWWLLPVLIFYEFKILTLPLIILVYFLWNIVTKNIPEKKVGEVDHNDYIKAFRPSTQMLYNEFLHDQKQGLKKILSQKSINFFLNKAELQNESFKEKLLISPTIEQNDLMQKCVDYAKKHDTRYVEDEHLFLAILSKLPKLDVLLATFGNKFEVIENTVSWVVHEKEYYAKLYLWQPDYELMFTGGFGKGMTGRVTPFLDSMSEDFTKQVKYGGFERYTVRETAIKKVAELLNGSSENILIIGDPGCGKTSVVKGIAYKIMEGTSYKSLQNKRIVSMDVSGIVSGTRTAGEIAERINTAIWEAKASGNIILFIDEIHNLVGGAGDKDAAVSTVYSTLEPLLSTGTIKFIGATNNQNYRKYIEPNGAFSRLFKIFELDEASEEETLKILKYDVRTLEKNKKLFITFPALQKLVSLSKKLIHERVLPDKAIKILDQVATSVENESRTIDTEAVIREVAEITHIPAEMVSQDEAQKLLNIEKEMQKMVIGQDHALRQVGAALKRARAGIRNENKPIASFLFIGTTGVGKTQTAKALAKTYFGNKKNMVRLDMSEYQQLDSLSRLLGTPDGSTKGILTEAIRTKPFTLLLLDEIEKAHPNILLTFLQVLDDGRLTDSSGTVIDFTNTIIIATSNVGTRSIQDVFRRNGTFEEMNEIAMKDVRSHYAPEFLNRFTGIIVFNPLSTDSVRSITKLLLQDVINSANEKNIKVSIKEEVINELMKRGYSPEWGARPMARVIEDTVELNLAERILSKQLNPGDEVDLGMEVFENPVSQETHKEQI